MPYSITAIVGWRRHIPASANSSGSTSGMRSPGSADILRAAEIDRDFAGNMPVRVIHAERAGLAFGKWRRSQPLAHPVGVIHGGDFKLRRRRTIRVTKLRQCTRSWKTDQRTLDSAPGMLSSGLPTASPRESRTRSATGISGEKARAE